MRNLNNIISGGANGATSAVLNMGEGSVLKNNIFINSSNFCLFAVNSSIIENNIFVNGSISGSINNNSIFNNNLFVNNYTFPIPNNNTGINNIVNQPAASIFVNQSGNYFSYTQDYHLQLTCPGMNTGRDGSDIGIYGGSFPWKEGSVPFNPHIQYQNVSGSTDPNGNLNVNIKVAAQDH